MEWKEKIKKLPDHPGVYIFKDGDNVLYVGKASSLKKRVSSYLSDQSPKTRILLEKANSLDFILTSHEDEAVLLEFNLIKEYRPRYNIRLKDDKKYPYIKVTINEEFPRILLTRNLRDKESIYLGPYTSAKNARQTLRFLRKIFPFKTCSKIKIDGKPCLDYFLHRCPGTCIGNVSREDYMKTIKQVIAFLEGKTKKVVDNLMKEMKEKAENLEFEEAAKLRDKIKVLESLTPSQAIITRGDENIDILGLSHKGNESMVTLLRVREGKWIGEENFHLTGAKFSSEEEILSSFIIQYYSRSSSFPDSIITELELKEKESIEKFLRKRIGKHIKISSSKTSEIKNLLKIATTTSDYKLFEKGKVEKVNPLLHLQRELNLFHLPYRIEGYDISQLKGELAVGSLVVFEGGFPLKKDYRRYRIKNVSGIDDYGMMKEVVRRRMERIKKGEYVSPDMILVDGGRGQVQVVAKVIKEMNFSIPIAGLAKGEEKIYLPYQRFPLILPRSSPALRLLMRVRDEAHRFAHTYHFYLRKKKMRKSLWEEIPGIGKSLLPKVKEKFSTIHALSNASVEEIKGISGIGEKKATKILEFLKRKVR